MPFPSGEQSRVISHRGKPLVVVAGPGTGKTRTLVERMLRLLLEDQTREVSFITFTRTSRRDTDSRLENTLGTSPSSCSSKAFPRTSTLHTFAKSLVHRYAHYLGLPSDFSVIIEDRGEKDIIFDDLLHDLDIQIDHTALSHEIACYRCTERWPGTTAFSETARPAVLKGYCDLLVFYHALDMEGLVGGACQIIDAIADELPPIFLQVDEYQDLNPIDQRFVKSAASNPKSQVVVVGDDAQSIYSFRHANYMGIKDLWASPDWEHVCFPDCQRLPAHILNAALDLIARDEYLGAHINRKPDDGRKIPVFQCTKSKLQMKALALNIQQTITEGASAASPLRYKDFLVLCPTAKFVDNVISELTGRYGIPAQKPVSPQVPEAIWPLILILRTLQNQDPLAIRQLLPCIGFSPNEIHALRHSSMREQTPLYDICMDQDDERIVSLRNHLEMIRAATETVDSFTSALSKLPFLPPKDELVDLISPLLDPSDRRIPAFGLLLRTIYRELGLLDTGEQIGDGDCVLVATLYAAKGLEAQHVYCLWMNSRFMPMPGRDDKEERRVMYVAMTRAKKELRIMFHEEFDEASTRLLREEAMSPLLREIRSHLEIRRIRTADLK